MFGFVANFYRPLTATPQSALEVMREIEEASQIKFTAIVNNSNLGNQTTPEDIVASDIKAKELEKLTGLPLIFTAVRADIADSVNLENIVPLVLHQKYFDIKE